MSAEGLEELFVKAIKLPPSERLGFLESACASDPELFQRLEAMIALQARAESLGFLNAKPPTPAVPPSGTATSPLPSLPTQGPGQLIGRYKLLEQIGEGGCGVVYVAEQEKPLRRRVALKLIKPGMDSRAVIARFEAERQALAMMDHPNIAKVFDAGTTEAGRPYFVMELVRGARITEYCDRAKLSMNQRLELFMDVCRAVQHAHQKAIIHRDLKPSNILVTLHDGVPVPKVIDFGIAKAIEGRLTDMTVYTQLHQFIGTPAYMSPEQVELSGLDIDTRSDIYSLGVLLYELLTGKTPFAAEELLASGLEQMSRIIREKEPPRPSTRLQTMLAGELATTAQQRRTEAPHLIHLLRGDLDWIVMKCLEKDRRRRYETANGLALEIRRYLHNEPVTARPPTAIYKFQKAWRRNKGLYAAGAAVAVALLTGLMAALLGWRSAQTQSEKAVDARQKAERAGLREATQRQWVERNLYAADMYSAARYLELTNRGHALEILGKYRPTKAGQDDLRGWEWRYLWNRCQRQEQFTLPGNQGRTHELVFSRDSNTLVSGDTKGVVRIWDLISRKELKTITISRSIYGLAVAPDGKALMIGWPDGVAIYDGPSFEAVRQLPGAKGPLALSPDGRTLLTGGTTGPVVWDPANLTEPLHRSKGRQGIIPPRTQISFSPDGSMAAIPTARLDGRFEVKVWDAAALRQNGFEEPPVSVLQRGGNDFQSVRGLAFSQNAQILAASQDDGGVQLWDPKTGQPLSPLESSVKVLNMRFLPDGKTLLTFGWEQNFRLWDISTRTNMAFLRVVPGHENEIWSTAVAPNGQLLASGSKDGLIKVWDMKVFQEQPQVKGRIDAREIADLAFPQDGGTMSSISLGGAFTSWDTATLQPRAYANLARHFIVALFSPQGTHLALGLTNGAVELWRVVEPDQSPRLTRELLPPQPESFKPFFITRKKDAELSPAFPLMTWSGNGKKLAAFVNELYVWDIAAGQLDSKLTLPARPDAIALSPDGRFLAAGAGGIIQLWDVKAGQQLSPCVGHKEWITHLAFSPDGKTLASCSFDNTAALWDVSSGRRQYELTSHTMAVTHLEFSPDGGALATRGADNTLRLWHVQTGRELITMEALLSEWEPLFRGLRFSKDGALLAAGLPGQIRFFRAPSLAELDAADATQARGR